ncbi:CAP-Gly domain [Seminavis robusta]|uniref:CAP-Gly domain n=1 Tax=Seminavis robusta TaxID=568900 RepID=A0A9N8EC46_9STRA|nr:CAP-Gly domain [Seminavis robusta]|eukprot:Sro865_g212920.1 CAP-Gly domain (1264) ;mRNA; r:38779-42738
MPDYSLNDPVFVNREGKKLEGVVAFVGKVEFAEGDDWVGVRLTGKSAGQGKNDGTVKSQSYFKCPANCGLFIRKAAVESRKLTKIEELRLRRELATSSSSSTASATRRASTASPAASTPTGRQSRLDELRQRRATIGTDRDDSSAALDQLNEKLNAKDEALDSMKATLASVEKELESAKESVKNLESENEALQQKTKASSPPPSKEEASNEPEPETWTREKQILEEQVIQFEGKIKELTKQMEKQKSEHSTEATQLRAESLAYKNELQALSEQSKQKGVSDTSHYKEKAVLQAQIAALRREVQDLKNERVEIDSNLEDLALDKEQLQEENEGLSEKLDEIKIDAETAQMEVEELKMELEEAKAAAERAGSSLEMSTAAASSGGASSAQSDDMAQALSIQNARLREALIRLREQSSVEKMELNRKIKAIEKEAEAVKGQVKQNADKEGLLAKYQEEVRELKDMVDQGAVFEGMVEDLSDKVMEMEERNVSLATTVRELEEAAELTSEMEEVQAEELKAMNRDLEDRDTVIRNLEEAIKMQRRREEDFNRTVGNYRSTVETLKREKEALMEMQQGGEGEKSSLLASSQKALARAAQLVQDAAEMRKKEALAALDKVEGQAQKHMAGRLERLLPKGVAGSELAAIRGELLVSSVAGLAASALDGIASSFHKRFRNVPVDTEPASGSDENENTLQLSDESKQDLANMIHQSECANVLIGTGSDAIRLLAAGQWPDLLSEQESVALGSMLGHSMNELDVTLRAILKSLKEEGVIDTHQSNVDTLRQAAKNATRDLENLEESGGVSLSHDWKPPGMELFQCVTTVKYSCLGIAAAVGVACKSEAATGLFGSEAKSLLAKLDSLGSEASQICLRLAFLDVQKGDEISRYLAQGSKLRDACNELQARVRTSFLEADRISVADIRGCAADAEAAAKLLSQFSTVLRAAKLNSEEVGCYHPLSPEARDSWYGLSRLARSVRTVDGDEDDVNFLMRARSIEHRLSEAVANEPKLSLANSKVTSLEKSLATRSKEIAMQNARLSELEKLLTKSSAKPSPAKITSVAKSTEELNSLREENRVLMEAMDVLQEQVAGYESEIRMLNTMKSPKRHGSGKPEARRKSSVEVKSLGSIGKRQASQTNLGAEMTSLASVGVLEAALFRPALSDALRDAAKWKNAALGKAFMELPPLSIPIAPLDSQEESKEECFRDDAMEGLSRLNAAMNSFRMEQATARVVDLKDGSRSARAQLRASKARHKLVSEELSAAAASARRFLL